MLRFHIPSVDSSKGQELHSRESSQAQLYSLSRVSTFLRVKPFTWKCVPPTQWNTIPMQTSAKTGLQLASLEDISHISSSFWRNIKSRWSSQSLPHSWPVLPPPSPQSSPPVLLMHWKWVLSRQRCTLSPNQRRFLPRHKLWVFAQRSWTFNELSMAGDLLQLTAISSSSVWWWSVPMIVAQNAHRLILSSSCLAQYWQRT